MTRLVAFLRAINVGGHVVKMADLRAVFSVMGYAGAETFIASGNVVFEAPDENRASIEADVERELTRALGYAVAAMVRTDAEVSAVATYPAFSLAEEAAAGSYSVGFLRRPLSVAERTALASMESDIDRFRLHDAEVYWLCSTRQSDSKFSAAAFERSTGATVTFRGLKTVRRLAAKFPPHDQP